MAQSVISNGKFDNFDNNDNNDNNDNSSESDNINEDINDNIKDRYAKKKQISDYITLLKFQLVDADNNRAKYKSKYEKYRQTFVSSVIIMLLFAIVFTQSYYLIACIGLAIGIFFTDSKKTFLWCHYIFYITLMFMVICPLTLLITDMAI